MPPEGYKPFGQKVAKHIFSQDETIKELRAEVERLQGVIAGREADVVALRLEVKRLRATIQPGTAEATVAALWELAIKECGHSEFDSKPPLEAVREEIERLRALTEAAYIEGFIESQYDGESLSQDAWDTSESKKKLG